MNFLQLTKDRYSVRSYDKRPVEQEKIDNILEAGNNAPTAKNLQPHRIYVIQSPENREKVKQCTNSHYDAPLFLLICYNEEESWFASGDASGSIDAAIVGTHMMFEVVEQGLGCVWVAAFNKERTSELFNLPDNIKPVAFFPIGYASADAHPNPRHTIRKKLEEIVTYI